MDFKRYLGKIKNKTEEDKTEVIEEDKTVQVVERNIGEFAPGGCYADNFCPFAHGTGQIEQSLFVARAFDGQLKLTGKF